MHRISFGDPAWQTTFPFRIAPGPGEWLAGVLLRCDEVNHWGSGTTFIHLLRTNHKSVTNELSLVLPSGLNLENLAQALAVPLPTVTATTYQAELARLYDVANPQTTLLTSSFTFHLCPACVAEKRMLVRLLTLPHITHCQEHQIALQGFSKVEDPGQSLVRMRGETPTLASDVGNLMQIHQGEHHRVEHGQHLSQRREAHATIIFP
jgi:TniQ